MHIVLVLTTGEGGIPHYTAELANSLTRLDAQVTLIKPNDTTADGLFSDDVDIKEWLSNPNISFSKIATFDLSVTELAKSCLSLRRLASIPDLQPDVIHFTHKPHSYLRPFIPDIPTETPVIETRHETENDNLFRLPGRDVPREEDLPVVAALNADSFLRHAFSGVDADGYIVHTDANKSDMDAKRPERSVETIPHGAFTVFQPDGQPGAATGETEEADTVLFFGNITASKDLDQVARATVEAAATVDDLTTVIAGSGSLPEQAEALVAEHPDKFEVVNEFVPNSEVPELFEAADIVVVPHRKQQGHSGTMTIAFSHGKPVVATNVGEFETLVRRSGAGYTVDPGDTTAMADSFTALLSDSDLRSAMGENSRQMADQLSWERVADETVEFYESVMNANR